MNSAPNDRMVAHASAHPRSETLETLHRTISVADFVLLAAGEGWSSLPGRGGVRWPTFRGEIMSTHKVNLDALIRREDFESGSAESAGGKEPIFKIEDLSHDRMYSRVLRKPDFQRTTNNWTPEMIVDLVKSWLDGKLVPALILWHSKDSGKVFIVDGAHRLSALIGWVNDDYGDGVISREVFDDITPAQAKFHRQTQELMAQEVGAYKELYSAGLNPPPNADPERVRRGRAIATVQPAIQRVEGDAQTAEMSFLKINSNPATIDPTDLDVIRARRKPNAIATRALMRAGTEYFSKLPKATEIEDLAKEVHDIVFGPVLEITTQSPDIPRAGQPYSNEAFKMVLDMVNMFNGVTPAMWQQQKRSQTEKISGGTTARRFGWIGDAWLSQENQINRHTGVRQRKTQWRITWTRSGSLLVWRYW